MLKQKNKEYSLHANNSADSEEHDEQKCGYKPCWWLKLIGGLLVVTALASVPFIYQNTVQIRVNTIKIESLTEIQKELRVQSEAIIKMNYSLETMNVSINKIERKVF